MQAVWADVSLTCIRVLCVSTWLMHASVLDQSMDSRSGALLWKTAYYLPLFWCTGGTSAEMVSFQR